MKRWRYISSLLLILSIWACSTSRKKAELAEGRGEYALAAKLYKELYRQTPAKRKAIRSYYAWHYAENYRALGQYTRALNGYRSAYRYHYPDSLVLLRLGQTLLCTGKEYEALPYFKRYSNLDSTSYFAQKGLLSCLMIKGDSLNRKSYLIKRLNNWNSSASDYAPNYSADGKMLIFTSSRSKLKGEKSSITNEADANLFFVSQDNLGKWSLRPDTLRGEVNSPFDDGVSCLEANGSKLYYSYAEHHDSYPRTAKIYQASAKGEGAWSKGTHLDIWQDSTIMAAHPSLSPSGKKLFFVSDVKGSLGGKDIYYIDIEDGKLSFPMNIGKNINSIGDELYPYAFSDSCLYFSSNGKIGYGGLDIYEANLLPNGKWLVELMPKPINSPADDYSLCINPNNKGIPDSLALEGILASSRGDARGRPHLYYFSLPKFRVIIEGYVMDREGYPIPNAIVRTVGKRGGEKLISTKQDGSYSIVVEGNIRYVMLASAKGFLNQYARFRTDSLKDENLYYGIDFYLSSRENSERLSNVYYAFDSSDLLTSSEEALEDLLQILEDNPDISIELSSHADRTGSDAYNQKLSEARANSVVEWLILKGVDKKRLVARGFGKTKPLIVSKGIAERNPFLKEGQSLDEDFISSLNTKEQKICDSLNRRSEFRVLEEESL